MFLEQLLGGDSGEVWLFTFLICMQRVDTDNAPLFFTGQLDRRMSLGVGHREAAKVTVTGLGQSWPL